MLRRLTSILIMIGLVAMTVMASAGASDKPKVAVVPFESIGVEASLGLAAAEILGTRLASREHVFQVVERTQLQRAIQELGYQSSAFVDADSAIQVGRQLGAQYIVVGSVTKFGESYTLNARIVTVETGEARSVDPISAASLSPDFVISLAEQVGARLDALINPAAAAQAPPTGSLPSTRPSSLAAQSAPSADLYPLVLIPAGAFLRGDNHGDGQADEKPVRQIYLDAYYIGKYEVTQAQYQRYLLATGRREPLQCNFGFHRWDLEQRADQPVVCINWAEAKAFCEWAGMRLPSEAEWEKAARGTEGPKYPWGDEIDCDHSVYSGCKDGEGDLHRVGSRSRGQSPYGIFDMAGNVWEWTHDFYLAEYYQQAPERNPRGPERGSRHVLRGGGYGHDGFALRSSNRSDLEPEHRNSSTGIRCAK